MLIFFFLLPNLPEKGISVENGKIALVRASMVVTYYIKVFRAGADRHNSILMSFLLTFSTFIKGTSSLALLV